MNELKRLLEVSTDQIVAPGLAHDAAALARQRRTRRRTVAATTSAVGVLAVVIVAAAVVGIGARPDASTPHAPVAPPSSTADPGDPVPRAPAIDPVRVQQFWDPQGVATLPRDETTVLPESLDPPAGSVPLAQASLGEIVAAVDTGTGIWVVDPGGSWREVPYPESALDPAFVRDTVALAEAGETLAYAGATSLWWLQAEDGRWRATSYPDDLDLRAEWDLRLALSDPGHVLVNGYATRRGSSRFTTWEVDLDTGDTRVVPYLLGATTASDGDTTAELRTPDGAAVLTLWRGDAQSKSLRIDGFDALTSPVLGPGGVAVAREVSSWGTPREPADWDGLLAFDPDDGTTRAYLPVRDPNAWYARAGLVPVAWIDTDGLLIRVVPWPGPRSEPSTISYLARWEITTGDISGVGSLDAGHRLVLATDLLAQE